MKNTFARDLEHGKIAEKMVERILRADKSKCLVGDVRHLKVFQEQDVDYLYFNKGQLSAVKMDVKSDSMIGRTNNFFIEDKAIMKRDKVIKQGWMHYSKADYIYYVDEQRQLIYIFSLNDMRNYIKENKCNTGRCNDSNKIMQGYLVSLIKFSYQYDLDIMDYNGNYLNQEQLQEAFA